MSTLPESQLEPGSDLESEQAINGKERLRAFLITYLQTDRNKRRINGASQRARYEAEFLLKVFALPPALAYFVLEEIHNHAKFAAEGIQKRQENKQVLKASETQHQQQLLLASRDKNEALRLQGELRDLIAAFNSRMDLGTLQPISANTVPFYDLYTILDLDPLALESSNQLPILTEALQKIASYQLAIEARGSKYQNLTNNAGELIAAIGTMAADLRDLEVLARRCLATQESQLQYDFHKLDLEMEIGQVQFEYAVMGMPTEIDEARLWGPAMSEDYSQRMLRLSKAKTKDEFIAALKNLNRVLLNNEMPTARVFITHLVVRGHAFNLEQLVRMLEWKYDIQDSAVPKIFRFGNLVTKP